MTIRRVGPEGKRRWRVDLVAIEPGGRRVRVRRQTAKWTRRDAERWERETRRAIEAGEWGKPREREPEPTEAPTLEEWGATVLEYAAAHNKPSEAQSKAAILRNHLLPRFGALGLDQIGRREIDAYVAELVSDGVKPRTVNNRLTVLRRALMLAVEDGIIEAAPRFRWLRVDDQPFDFLGFEEAARLLEAAEPGQWRTLVLVAMRTGLRRGELFGLRWDDVDLTTGRVHVCRSIVRGRVGTPKSKSGTRWVPLASDAWEALRGWRHLRSDLVFCQEDGKPLTRGLIKWPLKRACRKAGLGREVTLHDLRHTFASHLAMRGRPLIEIQRLMGHATISMTLRYAHLSPDHCRDAVESLTDDAGAGRGNIGATEGVAAVRGHLKVLKH